ncbi:hypothetical protein C7H84_35460 [Burkholderia sp. Nafp2/4-1b]|nr:hypothetical protein C7H84_35460 [Burkholderia sp. Nafp2/4-1b]
MRLFALDSDPRCMAAVSQLIVDSYENDSGFRIWANERLDQLIQNPERRAAVRLREGTAYDTTVTPEQIAAAGGVLMKVVLDEYGQLEPVNQWCVDGMRGKNAFIREFIRDAAALAHPN